MIESEHPEVTELLTFVAANRGHISHQVWEKNPDLLRGVYEHAFIDHCGRCNAHLVSIDERMTTWRQFIEDMVKVGSVLPCLDPTLLALVMQGECEELLLLPIIGRGHAVTCAECRERLADALVSAVSSRFFVGAMDLSLEPGELERISALAVSPSEQGTEGGDLAEQLLEEGSCPDEVLLTAYVVNRAGFGVKVDVGDELMARIESHLPVCPDCSETVEGIDQCSRTLFGLSDRAKVLGEEYVPCFGAEAIDDFVRDMSNPEPGVRHVVASHLRDCKRCRPLYRDSLLREKSREIIRALRPDISDAELVATLQLLAG